MNSREFTVTTPQKLTWNPKIGVFFVKKSLSFSNMDLFEVPFLVFLGGLSSKDSSKFSWEVSPLEKFTSRPGLEVQVILAADVVWLMELVEPLADALATVSSRIMEGIMDDYGINMKDSYILSLHIYIYLYTYIIFLCTRI